MDAQALTALVRESEWSPMHFHVRTYLAGHPLLRGFRVSATADEEGVTAELSDSRRRLHARHARPEWWKPSTPEHGREIADGLARALYAGWLSHLRRR